MTATGLLDSWRAADRFVEEDLELLAAGIERGLLKVDGLEPRQSESVASEWLCDAAWDDINRHDDRVFEASGLRDVDAMCAEYLRSSGIRAVYGPNGERWVVGPGDVVTGEAQPIAAKRQQRDPFPIAWVGAMQSYVRRTADGRSWDLRTPLTKEGAEYELLDFGLSAEDAKARLRNKKVTNAFGFTCQPGEEDLVLDEQSRFLINTYVPPTLTPREAPYPVISEVLDFLTAGDEHQRSWLVNWLAFAYQNPARPSRTAPILYGAQRTGKSLMARVMRELLGEENCATVRNEDIDGRFTSHFVTKLFVTVGEIETAEVSRATATLKTWTGEPRLVFEAKGAAAFEVPNRMKVLCTSNQTLPVNVERGDTRWAMFYQPTEPSPEYGNRMRSLFETSTNDWSAKGRAELEGFAFFLANYPVDVERAATPPVSTARTKAMAASRNSVELFADAIEEAGSVDALWATVVPDYRRTEPVWRGLDVNPHGHGMTDLVEGQALHALYATFAKSIGNQRVTGLGRFSDELERARPAWRYLTDGHRPNVIREDGRRQRVRVFTGIPRDIASRPAPWNRPMYGPVLGGAGPT